MKNENEKKGLFVKLAENKKVKKNSCCCNIELEEIPDEQVKEEEKKDASKKNKNSCC